MKQSACVLMVFLLLILIAPVKGGANRAVALQSTREQVTRATFPDTPQLVAPTSQTTQRPNFLIIISDDQRHDTMDYMPRTKARIFDAGVSFPNAYVTTPLCCPSRASMFTGMYAHNHGVVSNTDPLHKSTFIERLHAAGYRTGLVGKYLNSWPGTPRPEFDFWVWHNGTYYDTKLNVNGSVIRHMGYATFHLRDYANDFLRRAAQQDQPFALIFAPINPHPPARPAPEDAHLYPNLPPHRPPSHNEADISDKPEWLQSRAPLTESQIAENDLLRRRQLQSLNSLDQSVDSVLATLEATGKADTTFVVYLSDNGTFWGEHRLTKKTFVYEEGSRVPFAVRYPKLIPTPRVEPRLVTNIDIAPTIYELAGMPTPPGVDGRSLVPLLSGASSWREDFMIEGKIQDELYTAIHTDRYVYVEHPAYRSELYDLAHDPFQLENQIDNPAYRQIVKDLRQRLHQTLAGDLPPTLAIVSPGSLAHFAVGQTITLEGRAASPHDGSLPDSALTWQVVLHDAGQAQSIVPPTPGNNIRFVAPAPESLETAASGYLEIKLSAVDSQGRTSVITQELRPNLVELTFASEPAGIPLTLDGQPIVAPHSVVAWEAQSLRVAAPDQVELNGQPFRFAEWSHSGAAQQIIVAPGANQTYTVRYLPDTSPTPNLVLEQYLFLPISQH